MFPTKNGTPLSLHNLYWDYIQPVLERCTQCEESKSNHEKADHKYERDASRPEWHGWHAFRRGLATNLHDLGVNDLTIQRILRHSDVTTTRKSYIKTIPRQVVDAMEQLQAVVEANLQGWKFSNNAEFLNLQLIYIETTTSGF